ncbi:pyridoxal phosphate-dependent aminotransferase [Isachenkonia alkalipeptolytica]|uniref:Pyridoxal phosphate-dependent aminotransferase n=1 Tax=Isachenkonia alkalipeptolytica TaxID=2565777 RepID=A0AA44BCP3_9CLOT|nr:pyridoxal phosphate-dependent aminotransferase [Isachenkonia alkalipeptolytica]NBG87177.1 pyridoxal phosphate-dependent aminotransferase [Isachenkonia alkalipeptolytica]
MKHPFIAKRYWKDQKTPMGDSDELAKSFDDVIDLSLGDPDQTTPESVINAAFEDAKAGHTKYTDFRGDPELREAIRKMYFEDFNLQFSDREIMVTASACLGMYLALEAIIDDGDEVIIHEPCFTPYPQQIRLARGIPVPLDTFEEDDFEIDPQRLESLITERTKALVINTPNNPTGTSFSKETLETVAEVAKKHELILIADEIYGAYSYQREFVPMASIPGMKERTITINSFSKDYTMTGWRVGHVIAPDFIIETIQQINENVVFTAPSVSQRAALHALRQRKTIQPPMVEEYQDRVLHAAKRINKLNNMSVLPPKGTFYLFPNIKDTGLTSKEISDRILQEAHVLTLPGDAFGKSGEGYIRIACTVGVDKLEEAFDRIEKIDLFQQSPKSIL